MQALLVLFLGTINMNVFQYVDGFGLVLTRKLSTQEKSASSELLCATMLGFPSLTAELRSLCKSLSLVDAVTKGKELTHFAC